MEVYTVMMILLVIFVILALPEFLQFGLALFTWPSMYAVGVRVYSEARSLSQPDLPPGSVFETESGRFQVIRPEQCLFHPRPIGFYELGRGSWFKGRLLWSGRRAMVEARLPISVVLVDFIVVAFLTYYCFAVMPRKHGQMVATGAMLLAWAIMAFIVFRRVSITKSAAGKIADEYEAFVTDMHKSRFSERRTRHTDRKCSGCR